MWDWSELDTWMALTGALAAMSCALPGTLLVLRRQSLLGDALSHATLPGIILAFLLLHQFESASGMTEETLAALRPFLLFLGASLTGIGCGVLAEWLRRTARMEPTAALGVVYTTLFAAGLLLVRAFADQVHIDPGCVLYGNLETVVTDTVTSWQIPRAAVLNGTLLLINGGLLLLCFKEIQLCTFDAEFAHTLGFPAGSVQLAVLAATGATIVAAFESVGSILVIAMLIVPGATAVLLSDRLSRVFLWALLVAAASAFGGHAAALSIPYGLQRLLELPEPGEVSTAGMMAVVSGGFFLLAWLLAPQHGWLPRQLQVWQLQRRVLAEDVLGLLYRLEELASPPSPGYDLPQLASVLRVPRWRVRLALWLLQHKHWIQLQQDKLSLTPEGRQQGHALVRAHRLWEAYLAKHFALRQRSLHTSAEQAEHFLTVSDRDQMAAELDQPAHDPHGRAIPTEPLK